MERLFIDEHEFIHISNNIVENLEKSFFIKQRPIVVGILNGGKRLADYIGYYFGLNVKYVEVHSRDGVGGNRGIMGIGEMINISIPISLLKLTYPILIVDDIRDSGTTLDLVKNIFSSLDMRTCVLIHKTNDIRTDFYGKVVSKDVWIDFFWEKSE